MVSFSLTFTFRWADRSLACGAPPARPNKQAPPLRRQRVFADYECSRFAMWVAPIEGKRPVDDPSQDGSAPKRGEYF